MIQDDKDPVVIRLRMDKRRACRCEYPCDCGSLATLALTALADLLRRERRVELGDECPLPWRHLTVPERGEWLRRARLHAEQGPAQ